MSPDIRAEEAFAACKDGERMPNGAESLLLEVADIDRRIEALRIRGESAETYGDKRFRGLYAQQSRADQARLGERRAALVGRLLEVGVDIRTPMEVSPKPQRTFNLRVLPGGPGGFFTTGGGSLGCAHPVATDGDHATAEGLAIAEHKSRCL